MSIVGGLVHTQSLAAVADAKPADAKPMSRLDHWIAGHAWAIVLTGTAAFWILVTIAVYQLS